MECLVAPRCRLEELDGFLTDFDDITLAALKELAMERTRGELLADARGFYDGSRANDLLLEATTDMATLDEMKEDARQVAIGERERLLKKLGGREGWRAVSRWLGRVPKAVHETETDGGIILWQ